MRIKDQLAGAYQSLQSLSQYAGFGRKGGQLPRCAYPKGRLLRIEELEERQLLAVTATEYAEILTAYSNLGLPETTSDVNIIEIESNALSVSNLKAAIETAGTTAEDDLIVLRTTDTSNKITYAAATDEISVDINAAQKGKLTIVGFGAQSLTIDAKQLSSVMSIDNGADVSLANLTITGGKATYGDGIYNSGMLTVTNSTISENLVNRGDGGGIYNSSGTLTVMNSAVSENSVYYGSGGGIYNDSGTLTVINSTISGNSINAFIDSGGGICNNSGTLTVINSTISGNSMYAPYVYRDDKTGGGIYNDSGTLTVTNSTVSGNSADYGGGIYNNEGTLTVTNSIISRNYASLKYDDIIGTLSETSGHNIIGYNPLFVVAPIFDSNGVLTNADTLDLRLTAGSRAINAGSSDSILTDFDLDGNQRVVGNGVDVGAYEFQGTPATEPTVFSLVVDTLEDSFNANDGKWSLQEALYWATGLGTITFDESIAGGTIYLNSTLNISEISIDGGPFGITLDVQLKDSVMETYGNVTLNRLTITGGKVSSPSLTEMGIHALSETVLTSARMNFRGRLRRNRRLFRRWLIRSKTVLTPTMVNGRCARLFIGQPVRAQ